MSARKTEIRETWIHASVKKSNVKLGFAVNVTMQPVTIASSQAPYETFRLQSDLFAIKDLDRVIEALHEFRELVNKERALKLAEE